MPRFDDRLDSDIRRFVARLADDYACHPPMEAADIASRRKIAASVRAPWSAGGPQMARTIETSASAEGIGVRVRLHYPSFAERLPALVYAHGGGWVLFDLDTHDRLMREYAARTGAVVVGVDYSRSPEARFPVALDEMVAVVRWLQSEGESLGLDAARIAVGGDSAGANLALSACLKLRDSGAPHAVRAMLLTYGAFSTDATTSSHRDFGAGELLLSSDEMTGFWKSYLRSAEDAGNSYACPLRADLHGLPAAFLTIAELDILHDENLAMVDKMRDSGVPVRAIVYPGTVHGFVEAMSIARISAQALDDAANWFREQTGLQAETIR
ncbi:MAG: alpha/beta hydrolase fold domain-containing protein [Gammaproteobacteria bacterium]